MGEEPRGMTKVPKGTATKREDEETKATKETKETPAQEVSRLRGEIESTRTRLGSSVSELDRRRHELMDWRFQLRKHAGLVAGVAGGLVLAIAAASVYGAKREKQRNAPVEKARRVKEAVARLLHEPELVSRKAPKSTMNKVLGAVGATAVSFLAKRLMQQMVPAGTGRRP